MYQLTFSEQSLAEIDKLAMDARLRMIEKLSSLSDQIFKEHSSCLQKIQRNGVSFFRMKVDSFRAYLEPRPDGQLFCHYILPQHTLSDFLFRSKLPISEEQMIEQHSSFWKYVDSLKNR
ncbi:MAG: cytotoxic translational repressor of toxin-antitoxin stability system [Puniceicoccales bacterium]|jgi:mRNA interferase RelE/StbE|nr:cytotoxic translational repressor of toxin-antitoxin stability system [Puniceicoccales bacterium]